MLNKGETGFYFQCLNRTLELKQLYKLARRARRK